MSRWSVIRKWAVRCLVALVLLGVVGAFAVRGYLSSAAGTQFLAQKFGQFIKQDVTLDSFQGVLIGTGRMSNLKIHDPTDGSVYLQARTVVADLSVWRLAQGYRMPSRLAMEQVEIHLRYDKTGKLLTKLPQLPDTGRFPLLQIFNARITLHQEGRDPLTLERGYLQLDPKAVDNLTGSISDPVWGDFAIKGRIARGRKITFTGTNTGLTVTPAKLRKLPFIPAGVWNHIDADGPAVPLTVRFDFQPEEPRIRYSLSFADANVRLLQANGKPFKVGPVKGVISGSPGEFDFSGGIADSQWGQWQVYAKMSGPEGNINVQLNSSRVQADLVKLKTLPYVPASVWDQVQCAGDAGAKMAVEWKSKSKTGESEPLRDLKYRIELHPVDAQIHVRSIDLDVQKVRGIVIVENQRVTFDGLKGETAGGSILATGDLNFQPPASRLFFNLSVNKLSLVQLPARWDLPKQIEGKITGAARLTVTVRDGKVETHGTGKGQIEEAKLVGFRTAEPIQLHLHAQGQRFRFVPQSALLQSLLLLGPVLPGAAIRKSPENAVARISPLLRGWVNGTSNVLHQTIAVASRVSDSISYVKQVLRNPETTYLEARLSLDDVDLAELIARVGVGLPFEITGKVSLRVKVDIPVNAANDLKAYRFRGKVWMLRLVLAGVEFRHLNAEAHYRDGLLRLENLSGEFPRSPDSLDPVGYFAGTAQAEIVPRGNLFVDLRVQTIPVERLSRLALVSIHSLSGTLTGHVRASAPLDQFNVPEAWTGLGRLSSSVLTVQRVHLQKVSAGVSIQRGRIRLFDVDGQINGAAIAGSATVRLNRGYPFAVEMLVRGVDLRRSGLSLPGESLHTAGIDFSASVQGTAQPLEWSAKGQLTTKWLAVMGHRIEEIRTQWSFEGGKVQFDHLQGRLAGGSLEGEATLEKDWTGRLKLLVKDVDAEELFQSPKRLLVRGQISGKVTLVMNRHEQTWDPRGQVELSSNVLSISGVPAVRVKAEASYHEHKAWYHVEGECLGGKLLLDGKYPPPPVGSVSQPHGWIRIERVQLHRLWRALGFGDTLGSLRGIVGLSLPFRHDGPKDTPVARGRFEIRDLRWGDDELTDLVSGDMRLSSEGIAFRDVSGQVAGGTLRAGGLYRFVDASRNWFDIHLSQADAKQLILLQQDGVPLLRGRLDVSLRGHPGMESRGTGSIVLHRGKVLGVDISEWRVPLEFAWIPVRRSGELTIRESTAQIGSGRAQVRATLRWGGMVQLEGSLTLFEATLRALAGIFGDVSTYAGGRLSGRIDFGSANLRSLDDFNANIMATMREAQILQLPVLRQMLPYIVRNNSSLETTTGIVKGRLSGGVFRISELTLENPLTQMIMQGSVSRAGRLDLDVTATTSRAGVNPVMLRLLSRALPPIGPVPVGLILRLSDIFAERVVHLRVGGTVKSPHVQIEPIRLLSEQAARFFLTQAVKQIK